MPTLLSTVAPKWDRRFGILAVGKDLTDGMRDRLINPRTCMVAEPWNGRQYWGAGGCVTCNDFANQIVVWHDRESYRGIGEQFAAHYIEAHGGERGDPA